MKANRTWTRTAAGGTGLAAENAPDDLDVTDVNVTTIEPPTVRPALPLRGVALFYTGPTATLDVTIHLWEETAEEFLLFATETLTASEITRVALPAALDKDTGKSWQTMHVLVTLDGDGGATNGDHVFYLWGDLGP